MSNPSNGEEGRQRAAPPTSRLRAAAAWAVQGGTQGAPFRTAVPSMVALRFGGIAVLFITSILVARTLGPHDKGIYNLVVLIPAFYQTFLDFGITNGNFFYLARGELEPAIAYTNVLFFVLATLLVVAFPVSLLAGDSLAGAFPGIPRNLLLLSVLVLSPLTMHGLMVSGGLLMGTNRAPITYLIPFAAQILVLVGAVVVALGHFGLTGFVAVFFSATAVAQLLYLTSYHRGIKLSLKFDPRAIVRSLRFGAPLYVATLFSFLHSRVDQVIIADSIGPSALGQYALAISIGEMLWSIDMPVIAAIQYEVAHRSPADAAELVHRATRIIIITMAAACALAAGISFWLLPLTYGEAFRPAVPALLAYLPAVLFWSGARSLSQDIGYQRRRTDLVLYMNASGLAINLVMLALLIGPLGIVGAALASSASYLILLVLSVLVHCRLAHARPTEVLVPRADDIRWLVGLLQSYRASARRRSAE